MNVDIDDEDLSTADRGDNIDAQDDTGQARGPDGKFVAKGTVGGQGDQDEDDQDEDDQDEDDQDEDDQDEDDQDEDDQGEKPPKDDKNYAIRLRKAQEKAAREAEARERLEARLRELEAAASKQQEEPAPDPTKTINDELETLYEQVEEARADGETKTAAQLQRKIDALNRELAGMQAAEAATKVVRQTTEGQRFDAMLDKMEALIPVLDPKHEDFDPQEVKELEFQIAAYERMGMTPTAALAKAVKVLHRQDLVGGVVPRKQKGAEADETSKENKPTKPVNVAKALETAKRQPPNASTRGVNRDDTKLNAAVLSDEEFSALPPSKLAQMRGDFL